MGDSFIGISLPADVVILTSDETCCLRKEQSFVEVSLQADIVILTSDNPRRELPQDIFNGIISGFPEDMRELNANCEIDGGFLQDQGWVDETEREFLWYWGERSVQCPSRILSQACT